MYYRGAQPKKERLVLNMPNHTVFKDRTDADASNSTVMKNIGPISRQWLAEVGILTINDLRRAGSITTYKMLKERYPKKVSLNLLWGLEAAVRDMDWRDLTETDKEDLKNQLG